MIRTLLAPLVSLSVLASVVASVAAHPVPNENHDRSILVRLTPTAVVVEYRLEVDELRAGLDLPKAEIAKINSSDDLRATFCRYFADVLAGNLVADFDGKPLEFRCVSQHYTLKDQLNRPLGHLRCEYRMEAAWQPASDAPHAFSFRESNYELEDFNRLEVRLGFDPGIMLKSVVAPDDALLARKPTDFKSGDAERLRKLAATFKVVPIEPNAVYKFALPPDAIDLKSEPEDAASTAKTGGWEVSPAEAKPWAEPAEPAPAEESWNLLHLFLDTKQGVGLMLLFAALFGGVHALTPGHGKTLVAAYLVGERGTVWHALLLGLVTTITHTAAVIVIAAVLLFFPNTKAAEIQMFLELGGGFLILSLGFWLLYTRLTGRPDHVHLRGGPHHHDHNHDHDHDHDHHHPEELPANGGKVSVWALLVLGFKGGMVPCWDAIAMLAYAISAGRLWLGLPLLLAFSAGLAGVLTGLGVSVVYARNFAGRRFGQGERFRRVLAALPLISAIAITLVGFWLCYDSLHSR